VSQVTVCYTTISGNNFGQAGHPHQPWGLIQLDDILISKALARTAGAAALRHITDDKPQ
jgi:hypothetical protein